MRILLLTAGSRGDVDPFLALADRASAVGHEVVLGVTREFVDAARAVAAEGVDGGPPRFEVTALDGDFAALVEAQGVSPWAAARAFRSTVAPMMAGVLRSAVRAAMDRRPDVIVHHPKVLSAAVAAARLDRPRVLVEIVPAVTPTRQFPAAGITTTGLGPLNPLTYRLAAAAGTVFGGVLRDLRAEVGLPSRGALPGPARTLVPVSPALLPRPADWPTDVVLTGQWTRTERPGAADPELADFLRAGRVLCAGFGSMAGGDPQRRALALVDAAREHGLRVLLVTGWGGLRLPADLAGGDVLVRSAVAHGHVLPLCAGAVHHGGAGTTHAVVRAGLPSVVVPFLADQPFWARLLHRRGLAAPPVPARRLDRPRVQAALGALPEAAAVRVVADRMAHDDGCGTALDVVERIRDR